jgi:Short C-terminal domain
VDEPLPGRLRFNGRMVVIFGFGAGSPEDLGAVAPAVCPNCHNQVFFHHVRSKKSVRLYFVPVVPYGTDDYLVCPVCSRGLQISRAQLPHLRTMAAAATSFRAGRLSQAQYQAQVEGFWRQFGVNPAGQQLVTAAGPGGQAPGPPGVPAPSAAPARPPPAAAAAAGSEPPWISHLHQLAQLHDQGVLSDADFEAAKRRILEQEQQG